MTPEEKNLMTRLAVALDAALHLLDKEAAREAKQEKGKSLRQVTAQKRAEVAKKMVAEAFIMLGIDAAGDQA